MVLMCVLYIRPLLPPGMCVCVGACGCGCVGVDVEVVDMDIVLLSMCRKIGKYMCLPTHIYVHTPHIRTPSHTLPPLHTHTH